MDVLQSSFPPSNSTFRSDISVPVMKPLLRFLNRTKSLFFLDVYTYFPWSTDPKSISLEYALLDETNITYRDLVSDLTYTNLLDQMLDAVVFAMSKLGYPDIRIFIAEMGWPNAGDIDQIGANIYNAATYNRNLVKKLTAKPPLGTPVRPKVVYPAFIFSLYNENEKPGPATERHWGVKYPNESAVYELDLSGKVQEYDEQLPPPTNNEPYNGKIWCVTAEGANATGLASALTWTCGQPNISCDPIQAGKACYKPDPMVRASFAFSSYWAKYRSSGATCYFEGLAFQTTKDPSKWVLVN
ncbi:probable glucan endo-1,3-beta-glucosidase A6 [Malania oleifera]|uniref:probable glucan endo-1,3-beta-glucosidase A6 n=1 Tax=Malania oleifera TaxID=397392 RepID=UPI0025ADDBE2|nr:probable glucan endo-1,3-beta-glucosidase A6 [Malania oleifera]